MINFIKELEDGWRYQKGQIILLTFVFLLILVGVSIYSSHSDQMLFGEKAMNPVETFVYFIVFIAALFSSLLILALAIIGLNRCWRKTKHFLTCPLSTLISSTWSSMRSRLRERRANA